MHLAALSAMDRRTFLKSTAAAAATIPFNALLARAEVPSPGGSMDRLRSVGYWHLREVLDETTGLPLLKLPDKLSIRELRMGGRHDDRRSADARQA
jgi:hypothetical protein